METIQDFVDRRCEIAKKMSNSFRGVRYNSRSEFVTGELNELRNKNSKLFEGLTDVAINDIEKDIYQWLLMHAINVENEIGLLNKKPQTDKIREKIKYLEFEYCPRIVFKRFPFFTRTLINESGKFTGIEGKLLNVSINSHDGLHVVKEH